MASFFILILIIIIMGGYKIGSAAQPKTRAFTKSELDEMLRRTTGKSKHEARQIFNEIKNR